MRVTVLKEIPEDLALAREWNCLVERMEHPEVFYTYQWALAVGRAFHASLNPLLFLIYEADKLHGVAALATDKQNASASFLTASTADYCDIVSAPQTRREVLARLLLEVTKLGLRHLLLSNLPSDSFTWKALSGVSHTQGFHVARRPGNECRIVEFGSEEQRSTMVQTVARKKSIKQALKQLSRSGSVKISHTVHGDETEGCVAQIVSAQVARFLASGRISPLVRLEHRVFLKQLATLLSPENWLKISRLQVNEQPIAWNYGFRFGDRWFYYLPSFEVDYENCSPGSCLLRLLIEEGCADLSLREMDLGLGDESYKNRFATSVRRTCCVQLSSSLSRHALVTARNALAAGACRFHKAPARLRRVRDLTSSWARRLRVQGLTATIAHTARRVAGLLALQDEILFFEAPATDGLETLNMHLDRVTWKNLSDAAIANADDRDTLHYLMRSAARLKDGKMRGSVLLDPEKKAVHFLAVANVNGFHIDEINHTIAGNESEGMVIFDCWTPARYRGLGYYPLAVRWAAAELLKNEQRVWIFCAATETQGIEGILKAGFTYRYSLVRHRRLGRSAIVRRDRTYAPTVEASLATRLGYGR